MMDTHCHLTFEQLRERLDAVLAGAREAGVSRMISVGTTPADSRAAVDVAEANPGVYATVGLHPHHVAQAPDPAALARAMRALAGHPSVVALGEMGLDWHWNDPPAPDQRRALEWQLELAAEHAMRDRPIIIHNREATDDLLAMLRGAGGAGERRGAGESALPGSRFVFHCFAGTRSEVEKVLDFGAMVSFTGLVTFANAGEVALASDAVPMDRLMVETDSPFLTPEPHRGVRPNEPRYVADVARFLAKRRKIPLDEFVARTDANAERFFRLAPA